MILDEKIGSATIISVEKQRGPRGGATWEFQTLSDGRMAIIGPYTIGAAPKWVQAKCPQGHKLVRAGGTTYQWSGWITEPITGGMLS